jgi:O-acetyl-ADP-ribose deacetylase (regulator of RNase III)
VARECRVGTTTIRLCLGDIAEYDGDAVANAANDRLWMGSGVAGALKRKGGDEIEIEAMRLGPIPRGSVVCTGGGRLKAKYVIHAAVMGQDLVTSGDIIREATKNVLAFCDDRNIRRIALPAFGTGVGGFSPEECARIMFSQILFHLGEEETDLEEIALFLYDEKTFNVFERILCEAR